MCWAWASRKRAPTVGSRRFIDKDSAAPQGGGHSIPVTTGGRLGDILQEWAVRHAQTKLGDYFNNARVLFFSGLTNYKLAHGTVAEYTPNLQFADPLLQLGVPKLLSSLDALQLYASGAHYVTDWALPSVTATRPVKEWTRFVLRQGDAGSDRDRGAGARAGRLRHRKNWPAKPSSPPPSMTSAWRQFKRQGRAHRD